MHWAAACDPSLAGSYTSIGSGCSSFATAAAAGATTGAEADAKAVEAESFKGFRCCTMRLQHGRAQQPAQQQSTTAVSNKKTETAAA
mmetsp:Transcript_150611/g.484255  ORF Transcript_150611/g.484255 Transcript_150611/m.484255 type:complete len:87 (+) Transcript_150611:2-262(+)